MEDLEAILAEYASDDEGEAHIAGLSLEDILKEADDDDDEGANAKALLFDAYVHEVREVPALTHLLLA